MIIFFILNVILMIILSYYSPSVPELFLISIMILIYKKNINRKYLTIYVLLGGYFTDVFYFANYPIYTLSYYLIYLISIKYIRDFIIYDFFNLFRIMFVFIFVEKIIFMLFTLAVGLKVVIYKGFLSSMFEMLSALVFLFIYFKLNSFIERKKNSILY